MYNTYPVIGWDISFWTTMVRTGGKLVYVAKWDLIKPHLQSFIYFKATQGVDKVDPAFFNNLDKILELNIPWGVFHFFEPKEDPIKQANFFAKVLNQVDYKRLPNRLPSWLDLEWDQGLPNKTVTSRATAWLEYVMNYDRRPIVYTSAGFWNYHCAPMPDGMKNYMLAVANYTKNPAPILPKGWNIWTFWQYDPNFKIPGFVGSVDMNRFYGDNVDFLKLVDGGHPTVPPEHIGIVRIAASPSLLVRSTPEFIPDRRNVVGKVWYNSVEKIYELRTVGSDVWARLSCSKAESPRWGAMRFQGKLYMVYV